MKIIQSQIIQVLQAVHLFVLIFHCVVFSIPCMCLLVQILVLKALHFIGIQLAWKAMQLLIWAMPKLSMQLSQEILIASTDI